MSNYGTVQFQGKTLTLQEMATMANYGTDGGVRYYALALDASGQRYRVAWETTLERDATLDCYRQGYGDFAEDDAQVVADVIAEYGLDEDWSPDDPSDETLACDWARPVSVTAE